MSQILDAINKAEQQRQKCKKPSSRENLYQSLKLESSKKRHSLVLPLGLVFLVACAGIAYFIIQEEHWLSQVQERASELISMHLYDEKTAAYQQRNLSSTTHATIKLDGTTAIKATAPQKASNNKVAVGLNKNEMIAVKTKNLIRQTPKQKYKPKIKLAKLTPITHKKNNSKKLAKLTAIQPKLVAIETKNAATKITNKANIAAKHVSRETGKKITQKAALESHESAVISVANVPTKTNSTPTPSWKKNIRITAIVYHSNPAQRFALIQGMKIYEGGIIPNSDTLLVKVLQKGIIINDGTGDMLIR